MHRASTAVMTSMRCLVALGLFCGALGACERRDSTAGDASVTSGSPAAGEQPIEPTGPSVARPDAAVLSTREPSASDAGPTGTPPGQPSWVPKDAALTIVVAGDRDRNLGIAAPAPAANVLAIDAGSCAIGIEVRPRP